MEKYLSNQKIKINQMKKKLLSKVEYITDIFLQLNKLKYLYLDNNQITEIKDNSFCGLSNLENLTLSFNKITEIKENSICGLSNFKDLNLSGNIYFWVTINLAEIKENSFN